MSARETGIGRVGFSRLISSCKGVAAVAMALAMAATVVSLAPHSSAEGESQALAGVPMASTIHVNGYVFDCLEGEPAIPFGLMASTPGPGTEALYIVHMTGPVMNDWAETIQRNGAAIITYLPNFAYEVRMTPEEAQAVAGLDFVDWVGMYHPAYKIRPDIAGQDVVVTMNRNELTLSMADDLGRFFESGDGVATPNGHLFVGRLSSLSYIDDLAASPDVQYITEFVPDKLHDEAGMQIVGGYLYYNDPDSNPATPYRTTGTHGAYVNHLGWDGTGVVVGIADTGLGNGATGNAGHNDFTGRVAGGYDYGTGGWLDQHGHGTHCAGLIAADGFEGNGVTYAGYGSYYVGMGIGHEAQLYAEQIFEGATGAWVGPTDRGDILEKGYQGNARVHSNSWGADTYGAYDVRDEAYDTRVRDADDSAAGNQQIIALVSAGNAGPGANSIGSPANGKNTIAVGSVENYMPDTANYGNAYDANSDGDNPTTISDFSSRGLSDDGRIKPDILTPGQATLSTHSPSAGDNLYGYYSEDARYEWCSGTSQACPTAAGGAAAIYQWYVATYGANPSPAVMKALLINSAVDVGAADIPNGNEGWGRMYLPTIVDPASSYLIKDQEHELTTGLYDEFKFSYADATKPLKISLVYTDKNALTGAAVTLINDLRLQVTAPLGQTYNGNAFSAGWSASGTNPSVTWDTNSDGNDDRNNVECVHISSGSLQTGLYTVRVTGFNVPGDCDNDGSNDQDYALVVYNALDVTSEGVIDIEKPLYLREASVMVEVKDKDLNVNTNVQTTSVNVKSLAEPAGESVTLTETGGDTGIFQGTVTISATNSAGVVWVGAADTITATYNDADDGTGSPATVTDTAIVDGQVQSPSDLTVEWFGISSMNLLNDNVEGGNLGYTTGGDLEPFAIRTLGYYSASSSWDFGNGNYQESAGENSWLISPGLAIPAGATSATLSFYHWWDFEATNWDGANLKISTTGAGGTFTLATPSAGTAYSGTIAAGYDNPMAGQQAWTNAQATWVQSTFNLLSYAGQTVHVKWDVGVDNYATTDAGWRIDNIVVAVTGSGANADNLLNWTLSPDDGAGQDDIVGYNLYRADNGGGPWDATTLIDTVLPGVDTYTDPTRGEFDGINWRYVIRAIDEAGNIDPNTNAIPEIPSSNQAPTANAGVDQTGVLDYLATFDGSGSADPDGSIVTYDWTFTYNAAPQTLFGVSPTFNFQVAGVYTVTLTVTDDDGATDTDAMTVSVDYLTHDIAYSAGWNLISFAVNTEGGMALATVFADEWSNIQTIQHFDSLTSSWKSYDRDAPAWMNDLKTADETRGYWVKFVGASDGVLAVHGKALTSTTVTLRQGWNLVGFPAGANEAAQDVLAGTGFDLIQKFDGATLYYLVDMAPTEEMVPGDAYWVHVPADTSYSVVY